jgi:hypothetical protein
LVGQKGKHTVNCYSTVVPALLIKDLFTAIKVFLYIPLILFFGGLGTILNGSLFNVSLHGGNRRSNSGPTTGSTGTALALASSTGGNSSHGDFASLQPFGRGSFMARERTTMRSVIPKRRMSSCFWAVKEMSIFKMKSLPFRWISNSKWSGF